MVHPNCVHAPHVQRQQLHSVGAEVLIGLRNILGFGLSAKNGHPKGVVSRVGARGNSSATCDWLDRTNWMASLRTHLSVQINIYARTPLCVRFDDRMVDIHPEGEIAIRWFEREVQ